MLLTDWEREKFSCEGRPTATLRLLETVDTVVDVPPKVVDTLACTRTGVGTVPELMRTDTRPWASEVRLTAGEPTCCPSIKTPPAPVSRLRLTAWFGRGLPAESRTTKVTSELSPRPDPLRKISSGKAWTKPRLEAPGAASGIVITALDEEPGTETCTASDPCRAPHPLSTY